MDWGKAFFCGKGRGERVCQGEKSAPGEGGRGKVGHKSKHERDLTLIHPRNRLLTSRRLEKKIDCSWSHNRKGGEKSACHRKESGEKDESSFGVGKRHLGGLRDQEGVSNPLDGRPL